MSFISHIQDKLNHQGIGGKAKNLAVLEKLNFSVPTWIVIPQESLSNLIKQNEIFVPTTVFSQFQEVFGADFKSKTYAVRSSGMEEDGNQHSFAGQFETYLHVPFLDLEKRIKDCWLSSNSERLTTYRKENNLEQPTGISVIIQEMIEAEVSGVAFGIDPTTGVPTSKLINSVYGLGEGLVSGELNGDSYFINGEKITTALAEKSHYFVRDIENKGIKKEKLDSDKSKKSSLTNSQIEEICSALERLKKEYNYPQDIEFAFAKGVFYLLQTRPITAIANQDKGEYTVWDNSNIIESYPGITTPLTYSFIIKMYEMVYRQFVGILGVDKKNIEKNSTVFANTLGLVRGRVYYNLLNWYKMLAMVPGYSINAENMERMMGVKEKFVLTEDLTMSKSQAKWRTVIMGVKMIGLHLKLPSDRRKFQLFLDKTIGYYEGLELTEKSGKELIKLYNQFESSLLLKWKAPLTNDFFAMIWFGLLEKQTEKYFPEDPTIHNDLLCGSQDIISVEPIHQTIEICELIKKNIAALSLFENKEKEEIWQALKAPIFSEILETIHSYISRFGNRCVGELKLETISYYQQPELFIAIIKTYILQGIDKKSVSSNLEEQLRGKATKKVNQRLKGNPIKKAWFKYCLRKTRSLVSNRENLRYERTRGFGVVRKLFSVLGKKWAEEGFLQNPRDIFYLELNEIKEQESASFDISLNQKIENRKQEFKTYSEQKPPMERFYTFGAEFSDEFIYSEEKMEGAETDLKGIGCCPGKVKGKVRVVENPQELSSLNGDILVTSSTDPGWVTLFPSASAILVERGSLLSHSAIVSREMGIPCIVGITGLLRTLKTGDIIEINGSTGRIIRDLETDL